MPRMMAQGVLIRDCLGRWSQFKIPLITPFFSSKVCQAMVRSKKFIHMGNTKMNTMNPLADWPRPRRIMARG